MAAARKKKGRVASTADLDLFRMYGPEPQYDETKDIEDQLSHALNWCSRGVDEKDGAKELYEWMNLKGFTKDEVRAVKKVNTQFFMTVAGLAWLSNRGWKLPERSIDYMNKRVASWIEEGTNLKTQANDSARRDEIRKEMEGTVESQNAIKTCAIVDSVEDQILDGAKEFNEQVVKTEIQGTKKLVLDAAIVKVEALKAEYEEAKTDNELKEAFGHSTRRLNQIIKILESAVTLLSGAKLNKTVARKPRTPKVKSAATQVKHVKFKEKDDKLNIVSLEPIQLIGAQKAVIYNVKKRKLGMFIAANDTGLQVKGQTVINLDETKSQQKTVRETKGNSLGDQLNSFRTATKLRVDKLFEGINTMATAQTGRMSEDVLILKVYK